MHTLSYLNINLWHVRNNENHKKKKKKVFSFVHVQFYPGIGGRGAISFFFLHFS